MVAQDTIRQKKADTLSLGSVKIDSSRSDSVHKDSLAKKAVHKTVLQDKVDYSSTDSLRFEIKKQKVYLYQEADIKYQDISLKAGYVEIDFPKNQVYATSLKDTTGTPVGVPEFVQASQKFKSKEINYNFTTKRGYINTVITKQDEGCLLYTSDAADE